MEKFFNNAGPSVPSKHYTIDPLQRIDVDNIEALIAQERYFVLHAPRQTGKTTCLLELMFHLNKQANYHALYANIEAAQIARNEVTRGINTIASVISRAASLYLDNQDLLSWLEAYHGKINTDDLLSSLLEHWTKQSEKPTVLFLDEVDALVGDTLISLLRQIRAGYAQRPTAFPQAIILCGVRDVRDYRIHTQHQEIITGGSAFNIKAKSLRLGNLTESEVRDLWLQHTAETGQILDETIFPQLWEDTHGQPWLVNALGYELTWDNKRLRDRNVPITLEDYWQAKENLIQSRATHLDQLTDKLKEARVHSVISALLSGKVTGDTIPTDDVQYVVDLGLIESRPQLRISNRIYQEVIPRELTWTRQITIAHEQSWYLTPQRHIDIPKLLSAFQQFFRENADAWIERFDYKEAGPQLLLQAFLQRIINGGGRINREYGLGRKRTDLFIEWPISEEDGYYGAVQRIVFELKILYQSLESTVVDGLKQTAAYAEQCGADEAHLLIFDRRPGIAWDDKIWQDPARHVGQRSISIWGM
ncbi:AAA-like domain-containing protein [Candidatus Venteria ishoeyi]|uniref:AAA-like domain-containing protein n=1 Tax=Candidatus Venteria ishoeyi TaxID=1899563 RepID=UPI0025A63936|nr:AAA-like domain-containing protein [Candidatus Venteria ishoeyi]MDM8545624.1 AAA-like domain-containing protein [Candidatus Venteria ishoeyi]